SKRNVLIVQFLLETTILAFFALVLSFLATIYILPVFNSVVDKQIELSILYQWKFIVFATGILLMLGLLSGIYPSLYLSSLKIVNLIKGTSDRISGKLSFRKTLVTVQFAISIFLIGITLFISIQVTYLINKDLGFEKESILYTRLKSSVPAGNFDDLKNRLIRHPEILNGSVSEKLPFTSPAGRTINWEGALPDEKINVRFNSVSYDYADNFGIRLVAGRNFSRDFPSDIGNSCLINETAAKCFGWDNPVGKRINDYRWRIVGVVKDYHYKDMHNRIEPLILVLNPEILTREYYFAFRVLPGSMSEAKKILIKEFESAFPYDPFEFEEFSTCFYNENTMMIYRSIRNTILFFAIYNIFLAVVGLLGLVSYSVQKRNKEIGIRKINGCSVFEIFLILNREYAVLILLSLFFAYPGIYMIHQYFPGAYKLPLDPLVFGISTLVVVITALLTTTFYTYRAATKNPIESLRDE
ncbi:MAG: ABC transporter permease, partial [Bacteroidales bacterium]